jgi:hypothetical protein
VNTNKTLYAIVAFAPIVMIVVCFVLMGLMISHSASDVQAGITYRNELNVPYFVPMIVVGVLTMIAAIIGLILFAIHSQGNTLISGDKRVMWLAILLFTGIIGRLIYYFVWIAKEDQLNPKSI